MKLRRVLMVFAVFALVFAACGGGDDKTDTNASGSGDSSSSSEPSDSSSSSDGSNGVPLGGFFNIEKCVKAAAAFGFYLNPLSGLAGLSGDQLKEYEDLYGEFGASVPDDLEDDYQTVKDANEQLKEDLADVGIEDWSQFNFASLVRDQEKMQKVNDAFDTFNATVKDAAESLNDYVKDECKSFTAN